jgi:hypothetical protein
LTKNWHNLKAIDQYLQSFPNLQFPSRKYSQTAKQVWVGLQNITSTYVFESWLFFKFPIKNKCIRYSSLMMKPQEQ